MTMMTTSIHTSGSPPHDLAGKGTPVAIANALILAYLRDRDPAFCTARASFLQDLQDSTDPVCSADLPPLVALIEHWLLSSGSGSASDPTSDSASLPLSQSLARLSLDSDPNTHQHLDGDIAINHPPTDPSHLLCVPSVPTDQDESPHTAYPLIHASNILTSQALVIPAIDPVAPLLVTSAADKIVQFTHTQPDSPLPLASVSGLPAPALALAQHPTDPNLLAAGCMDGSLILMRALDPQSVAITHTTPTHTPRPCVTLAWTPDGTRLVTGGYNCQMTISTYDQALDTLFDAPRLHYHFANPIESLVVCPLLHAHHNLYALVATRDTNVLYLCTLTHVSTPVEFTTHDRNSVPGHLSFSVLHLAISPSGNYVLGATSASSGRLLLWRWTCDGPFQGAASEDGRTRLHLVRNYYAGGAQDEWSKPRVAWVGPHDKYFAVTSDTHTILVMATWPRVPAPAPDEMGEVRVVGRGLMGNMHLYTTTSAQVVARLRGHSHVVRDVTYCDKLKALVSGGFDQCVRVWKVFSSNT